MTNLVVEKQHSLCALLLVTVFITRPSHGAGLVQYLSSALHHRREIGAVFIRRPASPARNEGFGWMALKAAPSGAGKLAPSDAGARRRSCDKLAPSEAGARRRSRDCCAVETARHRSAHYL